MQPIAKNAATEKPVADISLCHDLSTQLDCPHAVLGRPFTCRDRYRRHFLARLGHHFGPWIREIMFPRGRAHGRNRVAFSTVYICRIRGTTTSSRISRGTDNDSACCSAVLRLVRPESQQCVPWSGVSWRFKEELEMLSCAECHFVVEDIIVLRWPEPQ